MQETCLLDDFSLRFREPFPKRKVCEKICTLEATLAQTTCFQLFTFFNTISHELDQQCQCYEILFGETRSYVLT